MWKALKSQVAKKSAKRDSNDVEITDCFTKDFIQNMNDIINTY